MRSLAWLKLLTLTLALASTASADVTLAPLFADHAVLQRNRPLAVWGQAEPGEHVTVAFKGEQVGATASEDGRWIVYLSPQPESVEPAVMVITGRNTITLDDLLVGEVWLASGQSNMEWPVAKSNDAEEEIAAAHYPHLREIKVSHTVASTPGFTVKTTGWRAATPETVGQFSAVAYYFARELHRRLQIPVGIVNCTYGGTAVEAWMSAAALRSTKAFLNVDARWQRDLAEFPERQANYPAERAAFDQAQAAAVATKTKNPLPWPRIPIGPGTPYEISGLFNGMLAPLQPYAIRGFIWYQGEGNWVHPDEYAELFPALIRSWRAGWGDPTLPFYFVQLASFNQPDDPTFRGWAKLREAQMQALLLDHTEMTTAIDVGDVKDIHPRNKQEVGRRLALIAKAQAYGIPGDFSGPVFERAVTEGSAMRVYFSHAATGLISYDKPVQALELAGADGRFYPALGRIDRGTLLVSCREVKEPVAVRYAWSNAPTPNLYNGSGLPALPFRSDR